MDMLPILIIAFFTVVSITCGTDTNNIPIHFPHTELLLYPHMDDPLYCRPLVEYCIHANDHCEQTCAHTHTHTQQ
jgi:hypothetical protein